MRHIAVLLALVALAPQFIVRIVPTAGPPPNTSGLVQQGDLTYLGAFRLPQSFPSNSDNFAYSDGYASSVVYQDAVNGASLLMEGLKGSNDVQGASIAQIVIPSTLSDPDVVGLGGLSTAVAVRGFSDPSNGIASTIGPEAPGTSSSHSTVLVYGTKLLGATQIRYDPNCSQLHGAWVGNADLTASPAPTGAYQWNSSTSPRWIGGNWMMPIPAIWQGGGSLNGKVISGGGQTSILGCAPAGPSFWLIDPDQMASQPSTSTPLTAIPLVAYYEDDFPHSPLHERARLGIYCGGGAVGSCGNDPTQVINGHPVPTVSITDIFGPRLQAGSGAPLPNPVTVSYFDSNAGRYGGGVFIDNTRSLLIAGYRGLGNYCYGTGTANHALDGTQVPGDPPNSLYCYDPDDSTHGDHAYPYEMVFTGYDANDLVRVRSGQISPWDTVPYNSWPIAKSGTTHLYGDASGHQQPSISWDSATRRLYVIVPTTDSTPAGPIPIVHVFRVGANPEPQYACREVIGYSQTGLWFGQINSNVVFKNYISNPTHWQVLWQSSGSTYRWADPAYSGWSNSIVQSCAQGSTSPDNVIIDVTRDSFVTDPNVFVTDILNDIPTVIGKYPGLTHITLQSTIGGPNHTTRCCNYGGGIVQCNAGETDTTLIVRSTYNHPTIEQAIETVLATGVNGVTLHRGAKPTVSGCGDFFAEPNPVGHLTDPSGLTIMAQRIAAHYNDQQR